MFLAGNYTQTNHSQIFQTIKTARNTMPRVVRIPQGMSVVLIRHAPTNWNQKRSDDLEKDPDFQTIREPEDTDSPLSWMGRICAFLCGRHLRKTLHGNGRPGIDMLAISTKLRAEQSAEIILHALQNPAIASRHFRQLDEIRPIRHSDIAYLSQKYQDVVDRAWNHMVSNGNGKSVDELIRDTQAAAMSETAYSIISEAVVHRASRSRIRSALERKKTHWGEDYFEARERAKEFLPELFSLASHQNWRTVGIMGHGKMLTAKRQLLEGFSDQEAEAILDAEGPPFPPHSSITIYRGGSKGNELIGNPQQIPLGLKSRGRLLALDEREVDEKLIKYICLQVGVKFTESAISRLLKSSKPHQVRGFSIGKRSQPFIKFEPFTPEPPSASISVIPGAERSKVDQG